ncbi:MAG: hypothetical protein H6830_04590 [Planctomycetes bacterium]|nr:hypothetical protein [Planctomycetota bacterium]MCB9912648.1 hypothetical protein [Planctomycetota bacterium]
MTLRTNSDPWGRRVLAYGLWGQSNADGTNCRWTREFGASPQHNLRSDGAVPGAFILDKNTQMLRLSIDRPSAFRALTPGYTSAEGQYAPWLNKDNIYFGMELSFADTLLKALPRGQYTVVIVKLGVGGTTIANSNEFNWSVDSKPQYSLLEPYLHGYLSLASTLLDGYTKDWRWAGMISMIGESDARYKDRADAWQKNMGRIIDKVRSHVGVANLPWWITASPRYTENGDLDPDATALGYIETVIEQQLGMSTVRKNVTAQNLSYPSVHADDFLHLDELGQIRHGEQVASWAARNILGV